MDQRRFALPILATLAACAGDQSNVDGHLAPDHGVQFVDGASSDAKPRDTGPSDAVGDRTGDVLPLDALQLDGPQLDAPELDAPELDAPELDAPQLDATPPFVPVPGVHSPLTIDPDVDIPDNHWLLDAYRTVLGRERDAVGYRVNRELMDQGMTREQMFGVFVSSAEFQGKPALADRSTFVTRLYQVLLGRTPSAAEVVSQVGILREADGSGSGHSWPEMIATFYASAEYKATNCHTSYYSLGAEVNQDALLLQDLFAGKARMQTIAESQQVNLTMPSAVNIWDQKVSVHNDPNGAGYLGFTRALVQQSPGAFNVALLTSTDAVNFTETAQIFVRTGSQTFYDPHVVKDNSVCPRRYVMALECAGNEGVASLCTSQSTTPGWAETWSTPVVVVDGCGGNAAGICGTPAVESASTGTTLVDGKARYVAWTQVYDGVGANDPQAHTYSQSAGVASFASYFGTVMQGVGPIYTMMAAEPQVWCTSAWDCNNRDQQDWKREGSYFYSLYNGANYYRCDGTWGVSVARSTSAVGAEYTDRLPLNRGIPAERNDTCGISYPMLNVINGELFIYYAYYPASGGNRTMRASLVPTP